MSGAYHLFYGDKTGRPGFDLTFFDWPNARPNRSGVGTVSAIALGVNGRQALDWWVARLDTLHVPHNGIQLRGAEQRAVLAFRDPEGQSLELVDSGDQLHSTHWDGSPIPSEVAIQGFYAVRLLERGLNPTAAFLVETLGMKETGSYQSAEDTTVHVFEMGPGGAGAQVHLDIRPDTAPWRSWYWRSTSCGISYTRCHRTGSVAPDNRRSKLGNLVDY